jgi:hypothetical protein
MLIGKRFAELAVVLCIVGSGALTAAGQVPYYVTDFTKTNDIYTNLNEQFPNTGPGVPGSGVGTPNSSFVFNPQTYTSANSVAGANQTTNGIVFDLTSNATGQDFTEISNLGGGILTIPVSVPNPLDAYFLVNGYNNPSATFTFTGSGGATETFSSVQLHDFNAQPAPRNYSLEYNGSLTPNFFDQTSFQVFDQGAGGSGNSTTGDTATYGIDEDTFVLSSAFAGQTLDSISITSLGSNPLLLGLTITGQSPSVSNGTPEPGSLALFAAGLPLAAILVRRARYKRG